MGMWKEFMEEEEAVGIVEIILILVVLIALVLIFRTQIKAIIDKAFATMKADSDTIMN